MVRIGLVDVGFMGMINYLAARKLNGARVAAICRRDEKKLAGDWPDIRGNFGPRGAMMDLTGLRRYRRFEEMLADPDINLVDICNPTHFHAETAIAALWAGKHALVEKAIQYVVGNLVFALQMTQHDIRASLYAPLRALICENEEGKTCMEYDRPTSLSGQFGNAGIGPVASMLDRKLEDLVMTAIR
jgi:hypothetical protein